MSDYNRPIQPILNKNAGSIVHYTGDKPSTVVILGDTEYKIENKGVKHDQEKPDLSLVPREASEAMAKALMHGAAKYGRHNYMSGLDWHRMVAAALRHITAFQAGEDTDSESGLSHIGHALASLAMLSVHIERKLGKDTRYKK